MPDWTPEPWPEWRCRVYHPDLAAFAMLDETDYRRARACTSACKGMRDPERMVREMVNLIRRVMVSALKPDSTSVARANEAAAILAQLDGGHNE